MSAENSQALPPSLATAVDYAPGVILSAIVAAVGYLAAPYVAHVAPIPNMVIALVIGIALNPIAARPATQPGMRFCVSTVLRWAVALLGLRVGLADIAALGAGTAILIVIAMVATVVSGFVFAKWYGRVPGFGALVGVGTAVCGASATLACSTVVPDYPGKQPDVAFVVVAVNALATVAMLIYPPLCFVARLRRADDRRDARRHHPRRRPGGWRWLRGVDGGRQHRGHRQAVPRVPAVAGGARRRLAFHPHGAQARRGARAGAGVCHRLLGAVRREQRHAAGAVAAAALRAGESCAGGSLDLGPAAGDWRTRARHLGQDHHRAGLAAHHHRARLDGGDLRLS